MVKVNLIEPKGSWYSAEKWKGTFTITVRQRGALWSSVAHIHLWGVGKTSKAFYTVNKVKRVVDYKEN